MGKVARAFPPSCMSPALSEMQRASNAKRTKSGGYPSVHVVVIAAMLLCIYGLGLHLGSWVVEGEICSKSLFNS
jgi:hypothetical protein